MGQVAADLGTISASPPQSSACTALQAIVGKLTAVRLILVNLQGLPVSVQVQGLHDRRRVSTAAAIATKKLHATISTSIVSYCTVG